MRASLLAVVFGVMAATAGCFVERKSEEFRCSVQRGDSLTLFTDGFSEAMNAAGQEVKAEIDAGTPDEAIAKIRTQGYLPTKVKEKAGKKTK